LACWILTPRSAFPQHCTLVSTALAPILIIMFSGTPLSAQTSLPNAPSSTLISQQDQQSKDPRDPLLQSEPGTNTKAQTTGASSADGAARPEDSEGRHSKRIIWIIPNYRSVSGDAPLPPLSLKDKFWLATEDSFDYSSFVVAGMLAGIGQAKNSTPQFHQEAAGYGRYYWHSFADQALGNYLTEAIVPAATREDPRYYTRGYGGLFHRSGYAISRLVITRNDAGARTFNFSEIVGNGAGSGISNLYYPAQERTWTKTQQKWLTQVALDGLFNILKEFWPDIDRIIFRGHY
jgi:hypothetical protein